jgi:hypothetical protein
MFGGKLNYESRVFISGQELSGINNIDLSYSNSANIAKPLGYSKGIAISSADSQKTMSISRDYIFSSDPLLKYTGDFSSSGSIHYEDSSYGFDTAYMTEYMINFAVGSPPKVNANFIIFGEMTRGTNASGSISHPPIILPRQGDISITSDNSSSNRVVGFDYSIKMTRKPIYTIGSQLPSVVELIPPLEYSAAVQIEIDDAFMANSQNFITQKQNKTISFSTGQNGSSISYTIPNASLVSEQLSASADGVLKLTLNYIGHS